MITVACPHFEFATVSFTQTPTVYSPVCFGIPVSLPFTSMIVPDGGAPSRNVSDWNVYDGFPHDAVAITSSHFWFTVQVTLCGKIPIGGSVVIIVYKIFAVFPALSVTTNMNRSDILPDASGTRVLPPPIVPSGPMLNPDGRDVPSPIGKLYGGFPPVTSGLYVAVSPEIHCGNSLNLMKNIKCALQRHKVRKELRSSAIKILYYSNRLQNTDIRQ